MPLPEEDFSLPISERNISIAAGTTRYYSNVQLSTCIKNLKYNPIGFATYRNTSGSTATLQYSQSVTKTTQWNVTGNVSGKTAIEVPVVAKIEVTLGLSVGRSTTTAQSSTIIATMSVPNNKIGTIYAFHSAAEVQGKISWTDMDNEGVIYGVGTEDIGGAFIMNGVYFENEVLSIS